MSQQNVPPAARLSVRSRRGAAILALLLGVGIFVPTASISTAAEPEQRVESRLLVPSELSVASRGKAVELVAPEPEPVSTATFAAEVVAKTNAERQAVGLPPLRRHSSLDIAAAMHAEDQRNVLCKRGYLTHTGTDGSLAVDRILRTGLNIRRWAENVACGQTSSDSVMWGWMNSSSHRANILHPDLTHIGVSVMASDSGRLYWVQNFATLR